MADQIQLLGRLIIRGRVEARTGLHIGAGRAAVEIGGIDNPVVKNPLDGRPYIPGSSLKGRMRSLRERLDGKRQNWPIGPEVRIHTCQDPVEYADCHVCQVFGLPIGGQQTRAIEPLPGRLMVRDIPLDPDSAERLQGAETDLVYTEVKWEVAIDRITSQATPRQMERVPAGAVFSPLELVYSLYSPGDAQRFRAVVECLQLVEDDALGGLGSRGSGKVVFTELDLACRAGADGRPYSQAAAYDRRFPTLADLVADLDAVVAWLRQCAPGA